MKWTNKGDIDCRVQLLSSFPPSLMFDPVDVKAGFLTKEPVWRGRKHHVIFFGGAPFTTFVSHFMPKLKLLQFIKLHSAIMLSLYTTLSELYENYPHRKKSVCFLQKWGHMRGRSVVKNIIFPRVKVRNIVWREFKHSSLLQCKGKRSRN